MSNHNLETLKTSSLKKDDANKKTINEKKPICLIFLQRKIFSILRTFFKTVSIVFRWTFINRNLLLFNFIKIIDELYIDLQIINIRKLYQLFMLFPQYYRKIIFTQLFGQCVSNSSLKEFYPKCILVSSKFDTVFVVL